MLRELSHVSKAKKIATLCVVLLIATLALSRLSCQPPLYATIYWDGLDSNGRKAGGKACQALLWDERFPIN